MALSELQLVRHELAEGYYLQANTAVSMHEAAELQIAAGGLPKNDKYLYIGVRDVLASRGVVAHDVQVRDGDTDALVGFGTLWQHGANGELSDLAVLPEHRRKGIGKAIIGERLHLAQEHKMKITYH